METESTNPSTVYKFLGELELTKSDLKVYILHSRVDSLIPQVGLVKKGTPSKQTIIKTSTQERL